MSASTAPLPPYSDESLERPRTDSESPSCFQLGSNSEEEGPTFNRGPCESDRPGEVEVRWTPVPRIHPLAPPLVGRLGRRWEGWGAGWACRSWLLRPCEVWPAEPSLTPLLQLGMLQQRHQPTSHPQAPQATRNTQLSLLTRALLLNSKSVNL